MRRTTTSDRARRAGRLRSALLLSAAATLVASALSGCGASSGAEAENGVTTLRYQGWNNQVTLPELAEDLGYFDGKVKLKWVGNTISGPQDIQSDNQIPYDLRRQYGFDPYDNYYYGNGYIYQVDPTTMLVQQVIQALLR